MRHVGGFSQERILKRSRVEVCRGQLSPASRQVRWPRGFPNDVERLNLAGLDTCQNLKKRFAPVPVAGRVTSRLCRSVHAPGSSNRVAQAKFRSHAHVDGALFVDLFGHGRDAGARLPEFSRHPGEINGSLRTFWYPFGRRTMPSAHNATARGASAKWLLPRGSVDWDAGLRGNVIQRNLCDRRFQSRKRLRMLRGSRFIYEIPVR